LYSDYGGLNLERREYLEIKVKSMGIMMAEIITRRKGQSKKYIDD
jgi:hypothetical protein